MYAENLKKIRKLLGLSVNEFADKLNVSARTLGSYERNERGCSVDLVTQLCKTLNVNANWFVTGEGEMFNAAQSEPSNDELAQKVRQILREEGVIK